MESMNAKEYPQVKSDPWAHRTVGMRCCTCMWFVEKEHDSNTTSSIRKMNGRIGRCRKNAPTIKGFVPVFENDWCGDHRLDENKI